MRIRRLIINNYSEIISLWERAALPYKPRGRDSKSVMQFQMKKNTCFFLGAYDKNGLVGTIVASYDYRRGWINRLAVDPKYRRKGVAQKLIAAAEKALRRKGARVICALVGSYNDASLSLFKKCGYVERRDIVYLSKRDSDKV